MDELCEQLDELCQSGKATARRILDVIEGGGFVVVRRAPSPPGEQKIPQANV